MDLPCSSWFFFFFLFFFSLICVHYYDIDYLNDSWMDSSGISFMFGSLVTFLLICLFHLISYVLI